MNEVVRLQRLLLLEEQTREMRAAQKEYFWRRDRDTLIQAKRLEVQVDHLLRELEDEEAPK